MRILITGASGLLGLNVALEAAPHHTVFGVAHTTPIAASAFETLVVNLVEPDAGAGSPLDRLLAQTRPDWVIHCAALANLEVCEKDPDLAWRINTEVPEKLARLVARGGARLLHVSTDAVFDGQRPLGPPGYTETDLPNPLSVYARTKLAGEQAVSAANPEALVARVNLFGFSPSGRRSLAEFFLNNLLAGSPMRGFTDVYFCPVLVNEIAHIFFEMLDKGLSGLYHVFSSDTLSKYAFGVKIAQRFGLDESLVAPVSVAEGGLVAARSPNLVMSTHKLSTALGRNLPQVSPMLDQFYTLYQQGYPQLLAELAAKE